MLHVIDSMFNTAAGNRISFRVRWRVLTQEALGQLLVQERNNHKLEPLVETPLLGARVYEAIKEAILSLRIRPGEMLTIGRLATQLRASRTPVRDALLILEREGLVTIVPQKGAYVTMITPQDVHEIFEMRIVLEGYASRVAAASTTWEELDRAEVTLEEANLAFVQGEKIRAADLGRPIHDLVVRKVGNERLVRGLNELETHYTRIRHLAVMIPDRFERSDQQHHAILAALRNGDPDGSEQAMTDHLRSIRDEVLANLSARTTQIEEGTVPIE